MAEEVFAGDTSKLGPGGCGGYAECTDTIWELTEECHTNCKNWQTPYAICGFSSTCSCICDENCADTSCKEEGKTFGTCLGMVHKCAICPSSCCSDSTYKLAGLGKSGDYSCHFASGHSVCKSYSRFRCSHGCDIATGKCKAAPATHKECSGGRCVSVAGAGANKCSGNSECKYKKCVGNECKSVNVPGSSPMADLCTRNSECEEEVTSCAWIDLGCSGLYGCNRDTQRTEICGPTGCTGQCDGETRGSTQCIADASCGGGGNGTGADGGDDTGPSIDPGASGGGAVSFDNPITTSSFEALISGIVKWILGIVVSLAILFLIIGGLMYITSAGNEEQATKAKKVILYAILGLGIIVLSYSIITELKDILGVK